MEKHFVIKKNGLATVRKGTEAPANVEVVEVFDNAKEAAEFLLSLYMFDGSVEKIVQPNTNTVITRDQLEYYISLLA